MGRAKSIMPKGQKLRIIRHWSCSSSRAVLERLRYGEKQNGHMRVGLLLPMKHQAQSCNISFLLQKEKYFLLKILRKSVSNG